MKTARGQRGVALLEALIGILIFSIGILAVVGMQATAIRTVSDSKYRSEAAFLANQLLTQMWTDAGNVSAYAYPGTGTVPARLTNWVSDVGSRLPGTTAAQPVIAVSGATASGATVQITVYWQLPEEASQGLPARNYTLIASVFTN
ncbi:MAG TPA: type IV pilus modification protein PilV [Burkholderiales bacterium]